MKNKPERSVEEIVEEVISCFSPDDSIHDYEAKLRWNIKEALQAERQRCEEMVEEVLATAYFDDWDCHVIDYEQVITIAQKYGITKTNNPK